MEMLVFLNVVKIGGNVDLIYKGNLRVPQGNGDDSSKGGRRKIF